MWMQESRERFRGWVPVPWCGGGSDVDVAYKKVGDGHPLTLWKCSVDVPAPPVDVLERLLRERHLWDDEVVKWRVVHRLDHQTEVFQYVVNMMVPHPTRDFCELRCVRVYKAVVTTTIRLRFDCSSTALKPFDDLRHDWAAALRSK